MNSTPVYAPLATIQPGMAIEFMVKSANDLYWTWITRAYMCSPRSPKQTEQTSTWTQRLQSTWRCTQCFARLVWSWTVERTVEMWATQPSCTRIAHIWRLFSTFARKLNRPFCCAKDGQRIPLGVTAVGGNNAGLNARAPTFVRSTIFERIGRPHLDVLNQECFIPPNIDLHMNLMPSPNNFVCNSGASGQGAQQENYKVVIQSVNFIIRTKKLTSTAHNALIDLLVQQNMRHHLSRIQMKHLSILANQTSINFDNVFTGAIPYLVIVGLVCDADLAGGYQRNPFNFQNFGVNPI